MDKSTQSLLSATAVGALVIGVYQVALPKMVDVQAASPNDVELQSAERTATWMSAAVVGGTSLLMMDPTIFVTGSALVVGLAMWHRSSIAHNAAASAQKTLAKTLGVQEHAVPAVGSTPMDTTGAAGRDTVSMAAAPKVMTAQFDEVI